MQDAGIEAILLRGYLRLQMEIIDHARKIGLGNKLQQSDCGGTQRRRGKLAAYRSSRTCEAGRIGNIELQLRILIAEISGPFRRRRHGGKLIHGVTRPGAIEVDEEKCLVMPVVNVWNHQRTAEVPADSLVPGRNLGRIWLGKRKGAGVQRRIAVFIVEACPHSIDSLPNDALHSIKRRYALRRRAPTSWSGPASAGSAERAWPATEASGAAPGGCQARSSCATRLSGRSAASEASAIAAEAGLAGIPRPLQDDAPLRAAKAGILIAAANRAVHKDCISCGSLSERALIVGRSAFRLLSGFVPLALIAGLIVKGHLLESATSSGKTLPLAAWGACGRGRSLGCRAILAGAGCAFATGSSARELPAAKSAPAGGLSGSLFRSLSCSLRVGAASGSRCVCRTIGRCSRGRGGLIPILRDGRRSFDRS